MSARNEIRQIMLSRQGAARMGQPVTDAVLVGTLDEAADLLDAANAERDAALARVARLERVLAVEGGDKAQAPPDWRPTTGGAWNGKEDNYVHRIAAGRWSWVSRDTRNTVRGRGESPSALEAMEAADAAGRWPGDRIHH